MNDLVSIIMPSYNSQKTIAESIESVLEQTYENWELLITDDCSSDDTVEIIKIFCERDNRIKLFELENNSGAGAARNYSINEAKGRFIAFLDSDDCWSSEKLSKQLSFMQKEDSKFSFSWYQKVSNENRLGNIVTAPKKVRYSDILSSNSIGCLTAIYDVNYFGKVYMPLIRKRQDMALWLKLLEIIEFADCVQECLAYYRTDSGMTTNKFSVAINQWRFYRDYLGLNLFVSARLFLTYSVSGLRKFLI